MSTTLTIRPIEKYDIDQVLDADRWWNSVELADSDFGTVVCHNPWSMSREALLQMIETQGTYTAVVTAPVEDEARPEDDTDWVVAAFSLEKEMDGVDLLWFAIHPAVPVAEVFQMLLDYLIERADRSRKRKRVTVRLRDRDEARIRGLLPLLQANKFKVTLEPNYFPGLIDAWKCEYESKVVREEGDVLSA